MKKNIFKNNAWFIILGLILLIVNIVLELGVLPLEEVKIINVLFWGLTILSKFCSTVGLALVIGFVTKLLNSNPEEQNLKDNMLSQAYSHECLESLNDEKKKEIINNCLLISCSEKQKYYLKHKVSQLYEYNKLHVRSNIDYITTASKENGKVKLHTVMSYRLYKTSNDYPKIIHSFDKSTSKVVSMSILYGENNNKKKYDIPKEDLYIREETIHQKEKYYINKVDIPEEIKNESSITLKITVEEEGHDHWAHLVWMSLYPTDTISYKIICKGNLTIKDPHIFDNQEGLYYIHKEFNENGQINEYTISCDDWTDQYTGFSLIISEP